MTDTIQHLSYDDFGSRDYYIQDYQGNIRMTERMDDWGDYISETTVSVTDYYPYGNPQKSSSGYKYSGKYLDRSYGLDLYDFGARQYDAVTPWFTSIDPLAENFTWLTPYNYCAGDPVNLIDRDGREPGFTEEVLFALRHPIAAKRIGAGVTKGMQNISTNATRFATRGEVLYGSIAELQEDRGSENGAFRHALWQATITSEFGEDIAKKAGDAHEDNPNIDMNQTIFDNIDDADQSVDLHNNVIGRQLGANLKGKGMQVIAISVLNFFAKNGLYVAKEIDGKYVSIR